MAPVWKQTISACLLWALSFGAAAAGKPRTLCFFSLNNDREFELTRAFLLQAGRHGGSEVDTLEFHRPERELDPGRSFRNMAGSGQVCDGLVISGHHTGSFSGARARGSLTISALEEMSCDPDYRAFFRRVNAVWLQGCRTLGAGPLEEAWGAEREFNADYHMQRVGADLLRSGVGQSFAELSFEFSTTLDRDNPLASRYLRVFPSATVFGWTRSSPGFKAKSEKSLLYHMAHMTHLSRGVDMFDPSAGIPPSLKRDMVTSLDSVLAAEPTHRELAIDAWLSHGSVKRSGLGYDNPDLRAYAPLLLSGESRLLAAGDLGCDLRNAASAVEARDSLARILADPYDTAHNLGAIWEVYQARERHDPAVVAALREQLVGSESLMLLLRDKMISPRTGLLMKIEYYSFYRALTGERNPGYERRILANARYFMLAGDLAGSSYDIRDFREALLTALDRHGLADVAFYQDILHSPEVPADSLYAIAWSFLKLSPPGARRLLDQIVHHPGVDDHTLRVVSIWLLENGTDGSLATLRTIAGHPGADSATLGTVASTVARHGGGADAALIEGIVSNPQAGRIALSQASLAVRRHEVPVNDGLVRTMISHPEIDQSGVRNVAAALAKNGGEAGRATLESLGRHPLADERTLHYVELAISRTNSERASR